MRTLAQTPTHTREEKENARLRYDRTQKGQYGVGLPAPTGLQGFSVQERCHAIQQRMHTIHMMPHCLVLQAAATHNTHFIFSTLSNLRFRNKHNVMANGTSSQSILGRTQSMLLSPADDPLKLCAPIPVDHHKIPHLVQHAYSPNICIWMPHTSIDKSDSHLVHHPPHSKTIYSSDLIF